MINAKYRNFYDGDVRMMEVAYGCSMVAVHLEVAAAEAIHGKFATEESERFTSFTIGGGGGL